MAKDISTSNSKRFPKALFWVFGLIIFTEFIIYSMREDLIKDYWIKFVLNEKYLFMDDSDSDYLVLANSIYKTSLAPRNVSDQLMILGLSGAKPMSYYVLLNRYLKNHSAPKGIWIYLDAEDQKDAFIDILQFFISFKEYRKIFLELSWRERCAYFQKFFATINIREMTELNERTRFESKNKDFIGFLLTNNGYMPGPKPDRRIPKDFFSHNRTRFSQRIYFDERDRKYLKKLADLCHNKNIRLEVLPMPVPEGLYEDKDFASFKTQYEKLMTDLKKEYSTVIFALESIVYFKNEYFQDQSHFNSEGSRLITEWFKEKFYENLQKMRTK